MFRSLVFAMTLVTGSVFAGESVLVESVPADNAPSETVTVVKTRVREVKRMVAFPPVIGCACEPVASACEPVAPACEPVAPACDPVIPACEPVKVICVPVIKVERKITVERPVREKRCFKKAIEKQYQKVFCGDPCDPCLCD